MLPALHPCVLYCISWKEGAPSAIDSHIPLLCHGLLWPASKICVPSDALHDMWTLLLSPQPLQGHILDNKQNHKTKVFDRHMALPFGCLFTIGRRKKLIAFLNPLFPDFQNNFAFFRRPIYNMKFLKFLNWFLFFQWDGLDMWRVWVSRGGV